MKSLKKSVIAVLVIGTLSVAGMAFANPGKDKGQAGTEPFGGKCPMRMQQCDGNGAPCCPKGEMGQSAQGHRHRKKDEKGPAFGHGKRGPRKDKFRRPFSPDMPQEIRAKAVEAAKLRIDLEDVLSQTPLNRDKAIELNGQIGKLKQEIQAWRFGQKLNRIEELAKKTTQQPDKTPEQTTK